MPTPLQENLADALIENAKAKRPRKKKELLVSTGYSESSAAAYPGKIIAQKGVQEALIARGFSLERAKEVVGDILDNAKATDRDRLKAASEVFKVTGAYAATPEAPTGNTYNFFLNPLARDATAEYERRMRDVLAVDKPHEPA
jgi:hypothetical protein